MIKNKNCNPYFAYFVSKEAGGLFTWHLFSEVKKLFFKKISILFCWILCYNNMDEYRVAVGIYNQK
jgi:hypothetical protein